MKITRLPDRFDDHFRIVAEVTVQLEDGDSVKKDGATAINTLVANDQPGRMMLDTLFVYDPDSKSIRFRVVYDLLPLADPDDPDEPILIPK